MHITLEESGGLNALLRIKVEEQDYREKWIRLSGNNAGHWHYQDSEREKYRRVW
jgi:hypothetical protein